MSYLEVQFLRCAAPLITAEYKKYASFFGICDALNLSFLLCHRIIHVISLTATHAVPEVRPDIFF